MSGLHRTTLETALRSISPRGRTLKTIRSEGAWEPPTQSSILITSEEPPVVKTAVGGGEWQSVDFLLDTEATFSVLTEAPDPLLLIHYHNGALWLSQMLLFPSSFNLQLGLCVVFWRVLIVPESPSPFLGRNILSKVQASVFMDMKFTLSLPLIE